MTENCLRMNLRPIPLRTVHNRGKMISEKSGTAGLALQVVLTGTILKYMHLI